MNAYLWYHRIKLRIAHNLCSSECNATRYFLDVRPQMFDTFARNPLLTSRYPYM